MPLLLNNTSVTFRAMFYIGEGESITVGAIKVPPGFTDLNQKDYEFFKKKNPRPFDLGEILLNEPNKTPENKPAIPEVEIPTFGEAEKEKPIEVITETIEDDPLGFGEIKKPKTTKKGKKK